MCCFQRSECLRSLTLDLIATELYQYMDGDGSGVSYNGCSMVANEDVADIATATSNILSPPQICADSKIVDFVSPTDVDSVLTSLSTPSQAHKRREPSELLLHHRHAQSHPQLQAIPQLRNQPHSQPQLKPQLKPTTQDQLQSNTHPRLQQKKRRAPICPSSRHSRYSYNRLDGHQVTLLWAAVDGMSWLHSSFNVLVSSCSIRSSVAESQALDLLLRGYRSILKSYKVYNSFVE